MHVAQLFDIGLPGLLLISVANLAEEHLVVLVIHVEEHAGVEGCALLALDSLGVVRELLLDALPGDWGLLLVEVNGLGIAGELSL